MRLILHYAKKLIDLSSLTTGALDWQFNTAKDTSISAHTAGTASESAELRTMLMKPTEHIESITSAPPPTPATAAPTNNEPAVRKVQPVDKKIGKVNYRCILRKEF